MPSDEPSRVLTYPHINFASTGYIGYTCYSYTSSGSRGPHCTLYNKCMGERSHNPPFGGPIPNLLGKYEQILIIDCVRSHDTFFTFSAININARLGVDFSYC